MPMLITQIKIGNVTPLVMLFFIFIATINVLSHHLRTFTVKVRHSGAKIFIARLRADFTYLRNKQNFDFTAHHFYGRASLELLRVLCLE